MPDESGRMTLQDVIAHLGEGKPGGGRGPQTRDQANQAFGQAGDQPAESDTPGGLPSEGPASEAPASNFPIETSSGGLDALGQYGLQQRHLATLSDFAGRGWQGMGPSTSLGVRLRGNQLWAAAAQQQRDIDNLRLLAELQRLGINLPGQPSAWEKIYREYEESKRAPKTPKTDYGRPADTPAETPAKTPASPPASTPGPASQSATPSLGQAKF